MSLINRLLEITKFNEENGDILYRVSSRDNRVKLLWATYEIKRKNTDDGKHNDDDDLWSLVLTTTTLRTTRRRRPAF